MIDIDKLLNHLDSVQKPGRYFNNELCRASKTISDSTVNWLLLFPDIYEIGISNNGIQILYNAINACDDSTAHRTYTPWVDMEKMMLDNDIPLYSLEELQESCNYDIFAITLPYELCSTNILTALYLAKIPFDRTLRNNSHPIVIAGGIGAYNPIPVSDFIDVFVIGDGENIIKDINSVFNKPDITERKILLKKLSELDYTYVPAINKDMVIRNITPSIDTNINTFLPVSSAISSVHNRLDIEIMRGCTRGCRFCNSSIFYRPVREKNIDEILQEYKTLSKKTGHFDISLSSLSSGDYSHIVELINSIAAHKKNHIDISLPSLRIDELPLEIFDILKNFKFTGITLAPEAGSERLRNIINKPITNKELFNLVDKIYKSGWQKIKLYFMVGLPYETDNDITEIINIAQKILKIGMQYHKRRYLNINITLSPFIPKPHTPFQWASMDSIESIKSKINNIRNELHGRNFKIREHNIYMCLIEALYSTGIPELNKILIDAWENGERFSSWNDMFNFSHWQEACRKYNIDIEQFVTRPKKYDYKFSYDFINTGVKKEYLWNEYKKSDKGITTEDCKRSKCHNCGITDLYKDCKPGKYNFNNNNFSINDGILRNKKNIPEQKYLYRILFSKKIPMIYLSHKDMISWYYHILLKSELPVYFTKGFSPHPKINVPFPIATGMQSEYEILEFNLTEILSANYILEQFNKHSVDGLTFKKCKFIKQKPKKNINDTINNIIYEIKLHNLNVTLEKLNSFRNKPDITPVTDHSFIDIVNTDNGFEISILKIDNMLKRIQDIVANLNIPYYKITRKFMGVKINNRTISYF